MLLNQDEIKDRIPHRFENLLLDEVEVLTDETQTSGNLSLTLSENDPLGRDIFLKEKQPNKKTVLVSTSMEILALASIVCSGKLEPNHSVFFAGISNFKKFRDIPANEKIKGHVVKTGDKGGFLKFSGELKNENGDLLTSGEMMAIFMETPKETQKSEKKKDTPPKETMNEDALKGIAFKSPMMVIADQFVDFSTDPLSCTCKYTYPKEHPFIKGHFPTNPIMMGIMQWMAIEDACLALAHRLPQEGPFSLSGNATILKKDGTYVAELKGFEVAILKDANPKYSQSELTATKKISFKDFVNPGETLYIQLKNIQIIS
ncbi:MAG: 3-hydroxymyristoyl/3-hydroxydecanoyl-(acyl carrier protein) dehydratase [Candidatus Marinamargulisbacteria bacterium]|jgi:3-hydroxymyristoyl/3-hydroxydecanoyl-(acyl carrier protein) dehydratase